MQAGVVGNLDTNRTQMSALVTSSQSATGALAGNAGRQSARRPAGPATRRSHRNRRGPRTGAEPRSRPAHRRAGPGQGAAPPLPDTWRRLPAHHRSDVPLMMPHLTSRTAPADRRRRLRRARRRAAIDPEPARRRRGHPLRRSGMAKRTRLSTNSRAAERSHPDEAAALETCRRVWAENRRQFFGSTKSPQLPAAPAPECARCASEEPGPSPAARSRTSGERGR